MTDWVTRVENCQTRQERQPLLEAAPDGAAAALQSRLVATLYSDPPVAQRLRDAGLELAEYRGSRQNLETAYALRGAAHVAYVAGQYEEAAAKYAVAVQHFDALAIEDQAARTRSSALQTLILLSRYEQAHRWAAEAEEIFLRQRDVLRLARLDSNVGNIFFRQDRANEAVVRYHRALEGFRAAGEPKDIAATLSNLAVAQTNLGEFPKALAAYLEARDFCKANGFAGMAAQADYNIAYLYFLRGDYAAARQLYLVSREHCAESGDAYHLALCDLDEAEMSLELNLTSEGEALALRATKAFEKLGMRYERAKALVSLAVACSQRGELQRASAVLRTARTLFVQENNEVWPASIDLLRAVIAFRDNRFAAAARLSNAAWKTLAQTRMPGRAALCQILRGRLLLRNGDATKARAASWNALSLLGDEASPALRFHAKLLEGEAEEMQGRWHEADSCYLAASKEIEDLRGRLDSEDLRISMLKDKLAVYEALVWLRLASPLAALPGSISQAFEHVQRAKSRTLADRLLNVTATAPVPGMPTVETLRQDLNWCYRKIEEAFLQSGSANQQSNVDLLRAKVKALETELLQLRSRPDAQPALSILQVPYSAEEIRAAIPPGTILLEYFESRNQLFVFLINRDRLQVVHLGSVASIQHTIKLLKFQLGKYRVSGKALSSAASLDAAKNHLAVLGEALLGPVLYLLQPYQSWAVAPHRDLHGVPFAALQCGGQYVAGNVDLSYAPSASVYVAGLGRPPASRTGACVLAVPDSRNPHIAIEAELVAGLLPDAKLLQGPQATLAAFRQAVANCGIVHLASHGQFRRDNPMFSSLQLFDGRLSLFDLTNTQVEAGLVTLSVCNSGSAVPVGGDELLGLMRGFLAAGARALLVTLWEVDDCATQEFMGAFYRHLAAARGPARAARLAAQELRQTRPHPFYWAPFIVVGG